MNTRLLVGAIAFGASLSMRGALVYSDNFNRETINGGNYSYSTVVTSADGAAVVVGGQLELSNDSSGEANTSGRVYVTTPTSGFAAGYSSQLDQNAGLVIWSFNMQQPRSNPSGFGDGNYGSAFVLGADNSDLMAANGYAVVVGNSGSPDPIRLVKFTDGVDLNSQLTDIVSASSPMSPLNDPGIDYLSLRVTYNPVGDSWSLFGRNDGTSFSDPANGSLTFVATASDSTYTASSLVFLGALWNHNTTAGQVANFDNFSVAVVPEPAEWGLISALGLFAVAGLHSWRNRKTSVPKL